MHNRKKVAACRLGCTMAFFLLFCSCKQDVTAEFFAMDTVMTMKICEAENENLLQESEALINNLEQELSKTLSTSDINRLNQQQTATWAELSPNSKTVLKQAQQLATETEGAFDFTLGKLSELWGFGTASQRIPSAEETQTALEYCGYEKVDFGDDQILMNADISVDLGGIAKGYAADKVVGNLLENDVENAMVSLGGNVFVLGTNHGKLWKVGIADPQNPAELVGALSLSDKAVVTSGDYQRYFEQDGERYHHIMDRKTGFPANSELASVTIVCDNATRADGYSTAVFVMGLEKGKAFIESKTDVEAVFITKSGEVTYTEGLAESYTSMKK